MLEKEGTENTAMKRTALVSTFMELNFGEWGTVGGGRKYNK